MTLLKRPLVLLKVTSQLSASKKLRPSFTGCGIPEAASYSRDLFETSIISERPPMHDYGLMKHDQPIKGKLSP